jgi:ketosteroid isomerase-like protein
MTSRTRVAIAAAAAMIVAWPLASVAQTTGSATPTLQEGNKQFILDAFDRWAQGRGDVFSLLSDDVTWHITGFDPAIARTYSSREALMVGAARPLADRVTRPLKPEVRGIWADGDDVIVHWDGTAPLHDGTTYRNTYLWIMTVRNRRIVAVTAFLDNAAFKAALAKPPRPN